MALVIARHALQENVRRRVIAVVAGLTVLFLGLYGLGVGEAFRNVEGFAGPGVGSLVDARALTGATLFGLAMFATLFLGVVLAAFLTLDAVRGDAERGLLQPLVVRPVGRPALLLGRFLGAAAVCAAYVLVVYFAALLLTGLIGGWWPGAIVTPGLRLVGGVLTVVALSLLGSVFLASTANGIAVFMVFGAGLVGGLLGQIGTTLDKATLHDVGTAVAWALPFEALYQDGLAALTAGLSGVTGVIVRLGPFGGAEHSGPLLAPYVIAYLAVVLALALWAFSRRDL
jgi:ABC-type transport system involved in multi-copper enzyme maturation permease subunit